MEGNVSANVTDSSSGSSSYSYDYDLSDVFKHPIQVEIFISTFVWSVSFFTVTGNILVFASFARDARLRSKVGNLFLLNLSSADFIVGISSLTFQNLWRYYGNWPFGEALCRLFSVVDYTATLQSTFAIILISFDRYLMVTLEVRYHAFLTRRKAVVCVILTWAASLMFYGIPIIGYDRWNSEGSWRVNYSVTCEFAVLYIFSFNIVISIVAFAIPCVLLVYFNVMVFMNIRKRSQGLVRSRKVAPMQISTISTADPLQESSQTAQDRITANEDDKQNKESSQNQVKTDARRELRRDKKAAMTLAMIVITYVICWLPYYITQLIAAYNTEKDISWRVWMAVNYMVWLNSALNPFLYAIASPRMRGNIHALLFCRKKTYNP